MLGVRLSKKLVLTLLLLGLLVVVVVLALYFGLKKADEEDVSSFAKAAVVTNGQECAAIGRDILLRNGTAADAAIAALFCEGVACLQSMGLGGGFLLTIYTKATGVVETLNARETAPARASENMYHGNTSLSARGGLAVAIPGEVKGYWELHKRYGRLPWPELIKPTITLCKTGSLVTPYLEGLLKNREDTILEVPSLREILINPKTNKTWRTGDTIKRLKLAETLEIIAREGGNALHNGSLTEQFVKDIQEFHGIISVQDMNNYSVVWEKPVETTVLDKFKLYSSPLPGSGVVLSVILNILDDFLPQDLNAVSFHRIVESFKFAYGARTVLGDPGFLPDNETLVTHLLSKEFADSNRKKINDTITRNDPKFYGGVYAQTEDHGTAHISIVAPNGDAVSVTSTINLVLGAMIRSRSTGILLNDEMDDFSDPEAANAFDLPPTPANFIAPGKRPMSSMCPSIVLDQHGDVEMVVGAAGGSKITTATALTILKHLKFGESISDAIDDKRIHHQLLPMTIYIESGFDEYITAELQKKNHTITTMNLNDGFAAVTAIAKQNNRFVPITDNRRKGSIAGIN